MRSFRTQTIVWFCASYAMLSGVMLAGLLVFIFQNVERGEKNRLRELGDSIVQQLDVPGGIKRTEIERAMKSVNSRISLLADEENLSLGYAIYGRDGELKQKFHRSSRDPFKDADTVPSARKYFYSRWVSHRDVVFYRWAAAREYSILVASSCRLAMVDSLLLGYLLVFPAGLLMSLAVGFVLARKVARPLDAIARTALKIEQGDLGARISGGGSCRETEYVADVLNSAFRELDTSFGRIEQFSSDVAHELKTPLTAVRGSLEVTLRKSRSPEEYQVAIAEGIESIAEINRIIDALLMLARPGGGDYRKTFAPVELAAIVDKVLGDLEEYAAENSIKLIVRKTGSPVITGSLVLLTQLVFNLVHNAIKYSRKGGSVTVQVSEDGDEAVLKVADSGEGIKREDRERIFDRFYRADVSGKQGHGLGLSIVKWVADLHRGKVSVDSTEGKGSVFIVRLPVSVDPPLR
ncbi:MAG: hypothetical protein C0404_02750 [Verrucomicrobia bacterium]|nr:hypothetical protein [Verrucomicrobiota bacterium]